jgi:glycosyltransferase involved in cell wall biosynthesis
VRADCGESVEDLIAALCAGLTERGHAVTLFATGDSCAQGDLRFIYPQGYESEADFWDWQLAEMLHAAQAYAQADDFDVIHLHTPYGIGAAQLSPVPTVCTQHLEMGPELVAAYRRIERLDLVAMSAYQASQLGPDRPVHLIHHGVDVRAFPAGSGRGGYLLFLGRMIADKGPVEAIEIARQAKLPLVLAGPEDEDEGDSISSLVDGEQIRWVGRVDAPTRNRLLADAAALLYPIRYPEPFGLVLIEALACGTPVLGIRLGAVGEIIETGVTGWLAEDPGHLPELVPLALGLDRARIRSEALRRFDRSRMIDQYERLFRSVAEPAMVR